LVKSVTRQVVDRRPSHVAGCLWSSASTDLQLRIPLYHLLERVIVKTTRERLKGGAGRPATPGPAGQLPLNTGSSCQVHPRSDTFFGGILNFLVIA
jgi:hypothetical protein